MSHYVYILKSLKNGRYYIGSTQDVQARLAYHNGGRVKATRYQVPYEVIYVETLETARHARSREYNLKRQKSRTLLDELIAGRHQLEERPD